MKTTVARLGFLGAGTIAIQHARAAQNLGVAIAAGCTRRPDSPNWTRFLQVAPTARRCDSFEAVLDDTDVDGVIVCLAWDVIPRILHKLLQCKKPMLIEKPLAFDREEIPDGDFSNKIVGYNRRFYENVDTLKQRLQQGDLKSVEVTISEDVERHIRRYGPSIVPHILEFASSHTLDLLLYLLGPLTPGVIVASPESRSDFVSYHGVLATQADVPVLLALNDNDPSPAGIRFRFFDHTTWVLAPLESLSVYKGIEVSEPAPGEQIRKYSPKKIMEQRVDAGLKPGFRRQMEAFVTGDYGPAAKLDDARRVLELIKEIRHAGSLSGAPQTAGSYALVAGRQ